MFRGIQSWVVQAECVHSDHETITTAQLCCFHERVTFAFERVNCNFYFVYKSSLNQPQSIKSKGDESNRRKNLFLSYSRCEYYFFCKTCCFSTTKVDQLMLVDAAKCKHSFGGKCRANPIKNISAFIYVMLHFKRALIGSSIFFNQSVCSNPVKRKITPK